MSSSSSASLPSGSTMRTVARRSPAPCLAGKPFRFSRNVRPELVLGGMASSTAPSTSSGRTFRLKRKGFPAKQGAGDLLATVRIVLPESSDAELEELMRKWRESKPYDPRKGMG